MAPAILDKVPSAANANGPDEVLAGETHLKDMGAEEGAFPDEPDKENVFVRYEDVRVSVQSAIKDDLFEDEAHDEDEDSDFVPKGGPSNPTVTKNAGEKFVPKRAGTPILAVTSKTDKKPDAAAVTGNPKDASAQKKNVKTAK